MILSEDLYQDLQRGSNSPLHFVCDWDFCGVLNLLVAIEDLHGENVAISCTILLRIRPHIRCHIPTFVLAVVLEHLDRLVRPEDYVTCTTRQNLLTTDGDVLILNSLVSIHLHETGGGDFHLLLPWGGGLLIAWNALVLRRLIILVEVLIHVRRYFEKSDLRGGLLRLGLILARAASDQGAMELD